MPGLAMMNGQVAGEVFAMRRCGTRSTRTSATSSTNGLSRQGPSLDELSERVAAASTFLKLGFVCSSR